MIIKETKDCKNVIFDPETIVERKWLTEKFPGLLSEGLLFYAPFKSNVVNNLYSRIKKTGTPIKFTPVIKELLASAGTLKQLPEGFEFFTDPLVHQSLALRFLYTYGSAGLLLEPGLGKTKVILDYIYMMKFKKSIIACPKALLFVWEEEIKKHRPELKGYVVQSTDGDRELAPIVHADVVIINYDKAVTFSESILKGLGADFIALDEGLIKNYASDRTKALTKLSKGIPHRTIMSGTLINNSPIDTFAPVRFIEPALVGQGVTKFKQRYEITSARNPNIPLGYRDIGEIGDILRSCSIVMTKAEWLKSLPKKIFNQIKVQMSDAQYEMHSELARNHLYIGPEFEIEVDNPLTALSKLNQISNGFVYYRDEDESEALSDMCLGDVGKIKKNTVKNRKTYFFKEQPKIQALKELIEDRERFGNRRSIIWFNMDAERILLEKALEEWGQTFFIIKGGEKDIGGKVGEFNSNPAIRFLLCQAKSVNYGVTVMGKQSRKDDEGGELDALLYSYAPEVCDEIFYSLSFSLEVFLQQQDRIHRIGQTRECNYWIILTNSKIDSRIMQALDDKLEFNRALLVDIAQSEVVF